MHGSRPSGCFVFVVVVIQDGVFLHEWLDVLLECEVGGVLALEVVLLVVGPETNPEDVMVFVLHAVRKCEEKSPWRIHTSKPSGGPPASIPPM